MSLTLRVANVLGLRRVEIEIERTVMLAGLNASGKTSVLECIAAACTQSPNLRGARFKKDAQQTMREGAKTGAIRLIYPEGTVAIAFPTGEVTTTGKPLDFGTRLGMGIDPFLGLSREEAAKELCERWQIKCTEADIRQWFKEHPEPAVSKATVDDLIARVAKSDWDPVNQTYRDVGTKKKGAWEHVTGRRWGSTVAQDWCPDALFPEETYDLDTEEAALETYNKAVEDLLQQGAGQDARLSQLREQAARIPALKTALESKTSLLEKAEDASRANISERSKHIDTADAHNALSCPKCKTSLRLVPLATDTRGKLEILPETDGDSIAAARRIVEQIDERQAINVRTIGSLNADIRTIQTTLAAAEQAEAEIAKMADTGNNPQTLSTQLEVARQRVVDQAKKVAAVKQRAEAAKVHGEILITALLALATSPDKGVRTAVVTRGLTEINQALDEIASMAGFETVQIADESMRVTYGGRAANLLSESERWRVNLVLAVALHERERGAGPLLVDRLDVLHARARAPVLRMFKTRKLTVVIGNTAKDRASVPDLALPNIDMGRTYWLEDGAIAGEDAGTNG